MNSEQVMPPDVGLVFGGIRKQFLWLNGTWDIYKRLFMTSQEDVDLLNGMAPGFFNRCQVAFQDDIVLRICRLCDRATQSGQQNMSLDQLYRVSCPHLDAGQQAEIKAQIDVVKGLSKPFRDVRNKRLAHVDLPAAATSADTFYKGIAGQQIEDMLHSIHCVLKTLSLDLTGGDLGFSGMGHKADQIITALRGARACKLGKE